MLPALVAWLTVAVTAMLRLGPISGGFHGQDRNRRDGSTGQDWRHWQVPRKGKGPPVVVIRREQFNGRSLRTAVIGDRDDAPRASSRHEPPAHKVRADAP